LYGEGATLSEIIEAGEPNPTVVVWKRIHTHTHVVGISAAEIKSTPTVIVYGRAMIINAGSEISP
jgi:hypothetical protein